MRPHQSVAKYSCPQTLLTPYYKALTGPLGAKIHFFHRTTELRVEGTGDERRLVGVKLQRQATVKARSHAYDPFLPNPPPNNPPALPPWPIVPNYDPRWARMLEDVAVIQTISMQLWFDKSEAELYEVKPDIDGNPGTGRGLLTGYTAGGRDGEQAFAQSLPSQPWIAPRAELG